MKRVLHAYGVLASPFDVSTSLADLGISHSLASNTLRSELSEKEHAEEQPAWPIILPSIKFVTRYTCDRRHQILLICDSLAQLSLTNIRILDPRDIHYSLKRALEHAVKNPFERDWKLETTEPTFEQYVKSATKPSFLNGIQTELYKITPYDLRKQVQGLVIGYLAGVESRTKLYAKLNSSYKLDRIKELLNDPKCGQLKHAVQMYTKGGDVEVIAMETSCPTFEILYLSKSAANAKSKV